MIGQFVLKLDTEVHKAITKDSSSNEKTSSLAPFHMGSQTSVKTVKDMKIIIFGVFRQDNQERNQVLNLAFNNIFNSMRRILSKLIKEF